MDKWWEVQENDNIDNNVQFLFMANKKEILCMIKC